jgi:hypothetical protein
MRDPDLDPLPSELVDLFRAERDRPSPPDDARARVFDRVQTTLGLPQGGGTGGSGAPETGGSGSEAAGAAPRPGTWLGRPLTTGLSGLVVGGLLGAFIHAQLRPVPRPPPVVAGDLALATAKPAAAPPPVAPEASSLPPTPVASTRASADATPSAAPSSAQGRPEQAGATSASHGGDARAATQASDEGPGRDVDLAAERAQLEIARTAVGRGQGARAIEALERHAKQFPRGRLSEEREGLWIQALLAVGRRGEARARAERFRKRFPRSLLLPALAPALGSNP